MELNTTQAQVEAYINYNGKNKYIAPVVSTTEETTEFVPLATELTTA